MTRITTEKRSIADQWIADGYHAHLAARAGQRQRWIKGARRYSETEQEQAKRAIAALCAEICEVAE